MKKLLAVLMVLSIATIANAGLVVDNTAGILSITGDGGTQSPMAMYLIVDGGATLDGGALAGVNAWAAISEFTQADAGMVSYLQGIDGLSGVSDAIFINGVYSNPELTVYTGLIVDGVTFTLPASGQVTTQLVSIYTPFDEETGEFGTPVMTGMSGDPVVLQTPEPITMTLLGLGGLFLRRRK